MKRHQEFLAMTVIRNIMLLVFTAVLGVVVLGGTSFYLTDKINTSASYANANTVPSLLASTWYRIPKRSR